MMSAAQKRMQWRCRRGMLELDLVFQDFIENHLDRLDSVQIAALDALLDLPDNDLWDLVMSAVPFGDSVSQQVLIYLRSTQDAYA
jgi:antitoxin CptB